MADLAELKERIITEMNREDLRDTLAGQLLLHIQRACEFYAGERFWFNAVVATALAPAGMRDVDIPGTVRRFERVTIPALRVELRECTLGEIERLDDTALGRPCAYAYYNDKLRLDVLADADYALQLTGLAAIEAPAAIDSYSSPWTNEAQDLISSRAQETLFRRQFRNAEMSAAARLDALEALARLKRETARRLVTPRRTDPLGGYRRSGFNIYQG